MSSTKLAPRLIVGTHAEIMGSSEVHVQCNTSTQFVVHMQRVLQVHSQSIDSTFIKCDGVALLGERYRLFFEDVYKYAYSLASVILEKGDYELGESEFCAFALKSLAEHTSCCYGSRILTLFSPRNESMESHRPSGDQDSATWMLIRAIMSVDAIAIPDVVDRLCQSCPESLAWCGMLSLLVRTPASVAFLICRQDCGTGKSRIFEAMTNFLEPVQNRTAVEVILDMSYNTFGTHSETAAVCKQIRMTMETWISQKASITQHLHQMGVKPIDEAAKKRTIYRLARASGNVDGMEWKKIVGAASLEHERREHCGVSLTEAEVEEQAAFWTATWSSINRIAKMSRRIADRRRCKSAVVVWFYCRTLLYVFARVLIPVNSSSITNEAWARDCADTMEVCMRRALEDSRRVPSIPKRTTHTHAAVDRLPGSDARWTCNTLSTDNTSRTVLCEIGQARSQTESRHPVCVGQGPFHESCAVAVVSYQREV